MLLRNFRYQLAAIAYQRPKRTALRKSLSTVAAMLPGVAVSFRRTRSISAAVHPATLLPLHHWRLARRPAPCLG